MTPVHSGRFAVPRQRRSMLDRPRLLASLHNAIGGGLILVHAPAGFGKTALLAQFSNEIDYRVAWLSLDGSCNAPEVFATQLAAAIVGDPGLPGPATCEKPDDLRAFLGAVAREAGERDDQPLLIVVDNCHELRGSDQAAEALGFLLEMLPESAEVILSGREMPQLTLIDRRVATGDCTVIQSADLALTREEVAALSEGARVDVVDRLYEFTRGWPAGVMAAISGALAVEPGATRIPASWETYLSAEVWSAVPPGLRETVLALAVPTTVDSAAAMELVGRGEWAQARAWLDHHDFLFETLDAGRIRLNPLFRQFLHGVFEREHPDRYETTCTQVVRRLAGTGQVAEAIELARDAHLAAELAELIRSSADELLHAGQFALLRRACEGLGEEALAEDPLLRALQARVLAHTGRPADALARADEILAADIAPEPARLHALLARLRALRLLGRGREIGGIFEEAEGLALHDPGIEAELAFHEAQWLLPLASDFARAAELLHTAISGAAATRNTTLELLARSTLGQLLAMRGDCPEAVTELSRAALGWRQRGRTSNLGWVLNNLGMAHLLVGDFASAIDVLDESVAEAHACENQRNLAYATGSLGDARLAAGQYPEARAHFEEAIRICAEEVPDETLASLSISGLASCHLGEGDLEHAGYFSTRALAIAEQLGSPFEHATCLLVQAAVDSASDEHTTAIRLAREAARIFEEIDAAAPLRLAFYRLALAHFRANDRAEALDALHRLHDLTPERWMFGTLLPAMREHPMFAQWAATRGALGEGFRELLDRQSFAIPDEAPEMEPLRFPRVEAQSLGPVHVRVGDNDVSEETWASVKSKELFFLFLAHREGLRKEEAVEYLYPELDRAKCNSAFHSNLYRVRRALYQESIVRKDGTYMLNPEGEFEWDVARFHQLIGQAGNLPPGSDERARLYQEALGLYRGPFAGAFYSEWAESLRRRVDDRAQESLATLGGFYAGREDFERAAGCMAELLERDPMNEEAAYQLAAYRARAGRPAVALAFIDDYSRRLATEFGERLPDRFRELRTRIAAGRAV